VWAFELTQRAGEIAQRLSVEQVKFVPGPLPESAAEPPPATPQGSPPPSPEDAERAASWAAEIEDEELRKLVQRAAAASLANAPDDRPF
jgi:hypothetical protein